MSRDLPGKNALPILERGIPLFRGGLTYREKAEAARCGEGDHPTYPTSDYGA